MTTSTLLGYLARFASFSTQSEVLCTQGLAYLLQTHEDARSALADMVEACAGIGIGDSLTWVAEAVHENDLARPDLEARMADGVPVVNIEAKLGADLSESQLWSYEAYLRKRNIGESVLLVLVPKRRMAEAARTTAAAFDQSGSGPWHVTDGSSSVVVSIISWDELFGALQKSKSERLQFELEQLQSMYQELSSDYIAPLASDEDLRQWRSSETDFAKLVDQVTRLLTRHHRLYPLRIESLEHESPEGEPGEYRLRYVCQRAGTGASCYSIGVRDSFAEWVTPIWMRFHRDTGNFRHIRQRIKLSELRSLESSGHVWIPMDVPRDVSAGHMIRALVDQAEEILRVASPAES